MYLGPVGVEFDHVVDDARRAVSSTFRQQGKAERYTFSDEEFQEILPGVRQAVGFQAQKKTSQGWTRSDPRNCRRSLSPWGENLPPSVRVYLNSQVNPDPFRRACDRNDWLHYAGDSAVCRCPPLPGSGAPASLVLDEAL